MRWVIADIHGMSHTLDATIKAVLSEDEDARFVFAGDYIDRGPFSKECIDRVIRLGQDRDVVCLRGNHDEVLDYLVNGRCVSRLTDLMCGPLEPWNVMRWSISEGMIATAVNYGVDIVGTALSERRKNRSFMSQLAEELREKVPDEHKEFLRSLPVAWSNKTHFVCHGFFPPNEDPPDESKNISQDLAMEILWSRFKPGSMSGIDDSVCPRWDLVGVFGHTPVRNYNVQEPISVGPIRLIDTGAVLGLGLTAYCCEEDRFVRIPTHEIDSQAIKNANREFSSAG